jgi:hypothetical protein
MGIRRKKRYVQILPIQILNGYGRTQNVGHLALIDFSIYKEGGEH